MAKIRTIQTSVDSENHDFTGTLTLSTLTAEQLLVTDGDKNIATTKYLPAGAAELYFAVSVGNFPLTGDVSKIYVANDTNLLYRWDGADYIEVSGGGGGSLPNNTNVVFVAATGNDSNSGLALNVPKKTVEGAMTYINFLSPAPSETNRWSITALDDSLFSVGNGETLKDYVDFNVSNFSGAAFVFWNHNIVNMQTYTGLGLGYDLSIYNYPASASTRYINCKYIYNAGVTVDGNQGTSYLNFDLFDPGTSSIAIKCLTNSKLVCKGSKIVSGSITADGANAIIDLSYVRDLGSCTFSAINGGTIIYPLIPNVLFYATQSGFPITGSDNIIYAAKDTNRIYRWSGSAYVELSGEIPYVLFYASQANFPVTGNDGIIYLAKDTNKIYRWSGSAYVEVSPTVASSPVSRVYTISHGGTYTPPFQLKDGSNRLILLGIGITNTSAPVISWVKYAGIYMRHVSPVSQQWGNNTLDMWYLLEQDVIGLGVDTTHDIAINFSANPPSSANDLGWSWAIYENVSQVAPFKSTAQAHSTSYSATCVIYDGIVGDYMVTYGYAQYVAGGGAPTLAVDPTSYTIRSYVDSNFNGQLAVADHVAASASETVTWYMDAGHPNVAGIGIALRRG